MKTTEQIGRIIDVAAILISRNFEEALALNERDPNAVGPTLAAAAVCNAIVLNALCETAGIDVAAVLEVARAAVMAKGAGGPPPVPMKAGAVHHIDVLMGEALALTRALS